MSSYFLRDKFANPFLFSKLKFYFHGNRRGRLKEGMPNGKWYKKQKRENYPVRLFSRFTFQ